VYSFATGQQWKGFKIGAGQQCAGQCLCQSQARLSRGPIGSPYPDPDQNNPGCPPPPFAAV
jgi:hypothetical protein